MHHAFRFAGIHFMRLRCGSLLATTHGIATAVLAGTHSVVYRTRAVMVKALAHSDAANRPHLLVIAAPRVYDATAEQ